MNSASGNSGKPATVSSIPQRQQRKVQQQQPGGAIDLSWSVQKDRVRIVVDDHGPGFDPDNIPDCTLPENIEKACGRGVMLMRAYMTSVEFNDKGNKVTLVYERN